MKNKYYAGIGSRETPDYIISVMINIAKELANKGYILRSGGAEGADTAFELGCDQAKGKKEIFLPWKNFNSNASSYYTVPNNAIKMAQEVHGAWDKCSKWAKILHGRNAQQIFGKDLKTPSEFVVCWTQGGKTAGGTATAIRIAQKNNIMVYNLGDKNQIQLFSDSILPIIIERKYEYEF